MDQQAWPDFLAGGGEVGVLMREHDWSATPLGMPAAWPVALRTLVMVMLGSKQPMFVAWGAERTLLYNQGYAGVLGRKHPDALGRPLLDVWSEIRDDLVPIVEQAYAGEAVHMDDIMLMMDRHGYREETHFAFSYTPVRDESGLIAGIFCPCRETTGQVLAERRNLADREKFEQLFAQAPSFMAMLRGPEHVFDLVNPAYLQLVGHRDVIGKPIRQALPEIEGQGYFEMLDDAYANSEAFRGNTLKVGLQRRPGDAVEQRFIDLVCQPVTQMDGRVIGIFVEGSDVTERVHAEERLRGNEAEARKLAAQQAATLGQLAEGVIVTDAAGRITLVNDAATRLHGVSRLGVASDAYSEAYSLLTEDGRPYPSLDLPLARAVRGETVLEAHWRIRRPDGSEVLAVGNARPVLDETGRQIGAVLTIRDDTDRKRAEDALRESRDRLASESHALETLNRTGTQVAAELDLKMLVQRVVDAGVELTGAQFGAFFYNVLHESGERFMLYSLSGAERSDFEHFGMPRPTLVFAPTFHGEGVIRSGDILKDARYGKNAPHSGMPAGHLPVRSYLAVPVISRSGEVIGGLLFGHEKPDIFGERAERVMTGLAAQAAIGIDNARLFEAVQKANAELEQRVSERTAELESAHGALRQAQKMEAVGQLTGGLAHDFNNLLAGISGSLELLQARISQGRINDLERYITAAQGASKRAAALTHRLLAFSRRQTLDPKPTDVNRLIAGMEDLVRRTVGPEITVEVVGTGGLWTTLVDPNQLENALLNLCVNARDAMPGGGRLTIETGNRWLDERGARERDLSPGQYLSLCVSDNGTGMTPDIVARAFDPFFTTKPIGMGTGLGLSMVYGFVRQSGGQARIYSEMGQGAMVCLYLPRHHGQVENAELPAELAGAPRAEQGETVLVVDDEPTVRMLVTEVLEDLGYTAIEAADGTAGLQVLQSDVRIDLLVTDVGLPGMNGRQLADAARVGRPDLKVLFITGYAENAVLSHGHLDAGMHVLTKPFAMEALAERIKELIAGR